MRPTLVVSILLLVIGGIYATWTLMRNQTGPSGPSAPNAVADRIANFVRHSTPQPIPDLTITDAAGKSHTLADFQGKTILVNFWATWCAPCREEMPSLDRLQAKLGDAGFAVVPISLDHEGIERVRPFLQEYRISHLTPYLDPGSRSLAAFKLLGLPTTLVIGPDGRELGRLMGPAEWDSPRAVALIETLRAAHPGRIPASP